MSWLLCVPPNLCISVLKKMGTSYKGAFFQHRDTENTEFHRGNLIAQHVNKYQPCLCVQYFLTKAPGHGKSLFLFGATAIS